MVDCFVWYKWLIVFICVQVCLCGFSWQSNSGLRVGRQTGCRSWRKCVVPWSHRTKELIQTPWTFIQRQLWQPRWWWWSQQVDGYVVFVVLSAVDSVQRFSAYWKWKLFTLYLQSFGLRQIPCSCIGLLFFSAILWPLLKLAYFMELSMHLALRCSERCNWSFVCVGDK